MIGDSGGLTLNVANVPFRRKKGKANNVVPIEPIANESVNIFTKPAVKPAVKLAVKPKKILQTVKPVIKTLPENSKKKITLSQSQSIWKKFKQFNKSGVSDIVKPISKVPKVLDKKTNSDDNKDVFNSSVKTYATNSFIKPRFKKKVTFGVQHTEAKDDATFVKDTLDASKLENNSPKKFTFLQSEGDFQSSTVNHNKDKGVESFPKKIKDFDKDSKPEFVSGKTTSLFYNNPEIPDIPHRAVNPVKEAVFSNLSFENLDLHPFMVKYLKESMNMTTMTLVQEKSIPILLTGRDALIRSQTGSGKTLAFALPLLHKLQEIRPKVNRSDGVLALIVVPTRELALQTYELFNKLVKSYTWIVPGYLVGGEKRKSEKARLRKGISILIGTPGRLIDHIQNTRVLSLDKVTWLVIDEADRLLDMGYERDVSILLETLNKDDSTLLQPEYMFPKSEKEKEEKKNENSKNRQTVLLSATLTSKVEKLAGLSLKDPVFVDACDENKISSGHVPVFSNDIGAETDTMVLPENLIQLYVVTPAKLKLVSLASFILWKSKISKEKKMLIFLGTQDMVDYYTELLTLTFRKSNDEEVSCFSNPEIELFKLHGNMKQNERTEVFKTFRKSHLGVLLCTDVAARGLDLPEVDWVIQFTGPTSVSDYVHRVGRTARGGQSGSSIIFLTSNEVSFIGKLENCRIRLKEEKMENCINHLISVNPMGRSVETEATNLQLYMERMVAQNEKLYDLACKAYSSWSRFYATYPKNMRDAFSVKTVHQGHYAKSFALREMPSVIINYARKKNLNEKRVHRKRPRERNDSKEDKKFTRFSKKTKLADISEFDSGLEPINKKKK